MTTLSAPQQAELEKPVTRTVYFVEFRFPECDSVPLLCESDNHMEWPRLDGPRFLRRHQPGGRIRGD